MTTEVINTDTNFELHPEGLLPTGIFGIYGPPGGTKSSIALSFPKPLVYYDFERGAHRAWGMKPGTQKIAASIAGHPVDATLLTTEMWPYNGVDDLVYVKYPEVPVRSIVQRYEKLDGWVKAWADFTSDFNNACENPEVKTIVWDTGTVEWGLCCDCFLEELQRASSTGRKQLQQIEYGEPNRRQNGLLTAAAANKKTLVLVHHETDKYGPILMGGKPVLDDNGNPKSAPTGEKIPDGFRYTVGKCDWVLYVTLSRGDNGVTAVTEVQKSALGLSLLDGQHNWFTYAYFERVLKMLGKL